MNKQRAKEDAEVETRLREFWKAHEHYDSQWARNFLHMVHEFLPFVFGFAAAGAAATLAWHENGIDFLEDEDWINAPEVSPAHKLNGLPIFKQSLELRAYAYYGLKLGLMSEPDSNVDEFLESIELELIPIEWGHDPEMERTIAAAFARRKIDFSSDAGVTPDELAALAGVSRKSIVNLLSPGSRSSLQTNLDNLITVDSARRWLHARSDFRPSIWQKQKSKAFRRPTDRRRFIGEPLFVPVARDGSWFSPADRHQRDAHYYVADGDTEEKFDDYWKALQALTQADSPRWRYSDALGRWRIKVATGWERKSRQEVDVLFQHGAERKEPRNARK